MIQSIFNNKERGPFGDGRFDGLATEPPFRDCSSYRPPRRPYRSSKYFLRVTKPAPGNKRRGTTRWPIEGPNDDR